MLHFFQKTAFDSIMSRFGDRTADIKKWREMPQDRVALIRARIDMLYKTRAAYDQEALDSLYEMGLPKNILPATFSNPEMYLQRWRKRRHRGPLTTVWWHIGDVLDLYRDMPEFCLTADQKIMPAASMISNMVLTVPFDDGCYGHTIVFPKDTENVSVNIMSSSPVLDEETIENERQLRELFRASPRSTDNQ